MHHLLKKKTLNHQSTGDNALYCRNPNLAAKQKKTKEQQLKERPRFSSVAKVPIALGGFKPQL